MLVIDHGNTNRTSTWNLFNADQNQNMWVTCNIMHATCWTIWITLNNLLGEDAMDNKNMMTKSSSSEVWFSFHDPCWTSNIISHSGWTWDAHRKNPTYCKWLGTVYFSVSTYTHITFWIIVVIEYLPIGSCQKKRRWSLY